MTPANLLSVTPVNQGPLVVVAVEFFGGLVVVVVGAVGVVRGDVDAVLMAVAGVVIATSSILLVGLVGVLLDIAKDLRAIRKPIADGESTSG